MRRIFLIFTLMSAYAFAGSLFDPASTGDDQTTTATNAATTQGTNAGFAVNGSHATLVQSIEKAISAIQQLADQAAADGKTELHDAFANSVSTYQALLEKARAQGLHPSLYPFALGKKGCLFAIRQGTFTVGPAPDSLIVPIQSVSWMRLTITAIRDDGSMDAEVRDNANRILLYRACLHGITSDRLKPDVTCQLQNMRFEITHEETGNSGSIYHLTRIPPAAPTPR